MSDPGDQALEDAMRLAGNLEIERRKIMSDEAKEATPIPTDVVTPTTPTFIIRLLAFQPENQDQPLNVDALCEALARQEKLLASYGLIVAGAIVSSVPAEGAGHLFAGEAEIKNVTPLN